MNRCLSALLLAVLLIPFGAGRLAAQVAGSGTIRGTITDSTGAVIPGATVTAVQTETGIRYVRQSSESGIYMVSPILPGHYTLTVAAKGFANLTENNIVVDASTEIGVNLKLEPGSDTQTVTVTASAALDLQTENATLGGILDERTVESIPMIMSDDQRMVTSLAMLIPGVQENVTSGTPNYTGTASSTNSGIVNGSGPGGDVSEIYIDGLPEGGDPRYVWTAISADAVSQVRFETAGYPATEQGMGTENFQIKSGTSKWHGSAFDYVRNTLLDTWGFFQPGVTMMNSAGQSVQMGKPTEHQNEYGISFSGPLYKNKVFFFGDYDGFREMKMVTPLYMQIPNVAMTNGDFSEMLATGGLGYQLYDPATQTCTKPGTASTCSRTAIPNNNFANMSGGVARISSISKALMNAGMYDYAKLANQSVPIGSNNFLATSNGGLSNWSTTEKLDINLSDRHKLAAVFAEGRQASVGLGSSTSDQLPVPYTNAGGYAPKTKVIILEDVYTITPHIVNEFKYGIGRYDGPSFNMSDNSTYSGAKVGIAGLPAGQATTSFPTVSFGSPGPSVWSNRSSYHNVNTDYSLVDNVQVVYGKHAITTGVEYLWLQSNVSSPSNGSSPITLNYTSATTGALAGNNISATTGFSFASYLLGGVNSASLTQMYYKSTGMRLHPFSAYLQDDIKLTPRLTVNAGLRWDFNPPFHEVMNRFAFFNPTATNPYSSYLGALQYAGFGASPLYCNCRTPAQAYKGNFEPRLGAAYSLNDKTVLHASFGVMYAQSQGTGFTTAFLQGNGVLGYVASPSFSNNDTADYPGLPAFWLAPNGPTSTPNGGSEAGAAIPAYAFPPTLSAGLGTYYSTLLPSTQIKSTVNYLDPRLGGRSPEYVNFSIGAQRTLYKGITIDANYVVNHVHFLSASGNRGLYNNQADPKYNALGPISSAANAKTSILSSAVSNATDLAAAQALFPNLGVNYTFPTTQAISQLIKPFPQYSGISDSFDSDGNTSYNSLQVSLRERTPLHGLTFTVNWTWSKEMDDVGTYRTGYGLRNAEWSEGTSEIPQVITGYAVYDIPAGKGHIVGWSNPVLNQIVGHWRLSGLATFASGSPLAITTAGCNTMGGTCMPNLNPNYTGNLKPNGKYGSGMTWSNASTRQFIDPSAFVTPTSYTYGNAPRTAPLGLYGPGNWDVDMSLRRSFKVYREAEIVVQADLFNVFNTVIFGGLNTTLTAGTATQGNTPVITYAPSTTAAFGTFSKQANQTRDAQLAMHINF